MSQPTWLQRLFGIRPAEQSAPSLEQQRKDLEEQIRIDRLKKARKLTESYADTDYWLTAYSDLLSRYKDGFALAYPITQPTDRRYGSNFPFWYSEQQLGLIRAQSRLVSTMSPNAQGLLNGLCSYVIGSGYKYDVVAKPDREVPDNVLTKTQDIIDEFIENNSWQEMEQELFWRSREDGEFFLRMFVQENGKMMVRVIEPEQVFMPPGSQLSDYSYGIKTDADDVNNVICYAVSYIAPGGEGTDIANPMATEEVPAAEMVHLKVNTKRNIKRGLPDFSYDTLDAFQTAAKLRANLGEGSAVQAAIAGVRQHDAASFNQVDSFVNQQTDYAQYSPVTQRATDFAQIKSGTFVDIPKGMNFVPPPGAAANAIAGHLEVFQALLRSAGNRHNAPEWLVSSDASNNNYASSMTAESPFLRHCKRLQELYKRPFLRVIRTALENAIDAGRLPSNLLDFVDITATPPELEVQDKNAAATANQIYAGLGVKSRQTIAHELGLDWDTEVTNQQEYAEQMGGTSDLPMPGMPGADAGPDDGSDGPDGQSGGPMPAPASGAALNGAQVQSLIGLATQAINGEIPMDSAVAIAKAAFPGVDPSLAASIFHQVVKSADAGDDPEGLRHRISEAMQVSGESVEGRYGHIDFSPPAGAQAAAKRALKVRSGKPESQRGMTATGIARARDLANGKSLSPETVRRMLSFFSRHEVDKQGASWDDQGKGWQAWNGWGGDAGYAWARKIVRQMDAADKAITEGRWVTMGAHSKAAHNREEGDDGKKRGGVPVYIDDDGTITKGPAHMTGKKPSEISRQSRIGAEPVPVQGTIFGHHTEPPKGMQEPAPEPKPTTETPKQAEAPKLAKSPKADEPKAFDKQPQYDEIDHQIMSDADAMGLDPHAVKAHADAEFKKAKERYQAAEKLRKDVRQHYRTLSGGKTMPPPNWEGWEKGDITQLPHYDTLLQAVAHTGSEYVDSGLFDPQGATGNENLSKLDSNLAILWDVIHPRRTLKKPNKEQVFRQALDDAKEMGMEKTEQKPDVPFDIPLTDHPDDYAGRDWADEEGDTAQPAKAQAGGSDPWDMPGEKEQTPATAAQTEPKQPAPETQPKQSTATTERFKITGSGKQFNQALALVRKRGGKYDSASKTWEFPAGKIDDEDVRLFGLVKTSNEKTQLATPSQPTAVTAPSHEETRKTLGDIVRRGTPNNEEAELSPEKFTAFVDDVTKENPAIGERIKGVFGAIRWMKADGRIKPADADAWRNMPMPQKLDVLAAVASENDGDYGQRGMADKFLKNLRAVAEKTPTNDQQPEQSPEERQDELRRTVSDRIGAAARAAGEKAAQAASGETAYEYDPKGGLSDNEQRAIHNAASGMNRNEARQDAITRETMRQYANLTGEEREAMGDIVRDYVRRNYVQHKDKYGAADMMHPDDAKKFGVQQKTTPAAKEPTPEPKSQQTADKPDFSISPEDSGYWGEQIAKLVDDPRNITREEYQKIDDIHKHLDSADGDEFNQARKVAVARATDAGRIVNGPTGTSKSVRRAEKKFGNLLSPERQAKKKAAEVNPEAARMADKLAQRVVGDFIRGGFTTQHDDFAAAFRDLDDATKKQVVKELHGRGLISDALAKQRKFRGREIADDVARMTSDLISTHKAKAINRHVPFSDSDAYKRAMGQSQPKTKPPEESSDDEPAPAGKLAATRTRDGKPINFEKPITGPSGAKLNGYEWQWTQGQKYSAREDGMVDAKVSDWEKSEASSETGKQVVHQFHVTDKDGTDHLVSLEGAARMLGFAPTQVKQFKNVSSAVKTLAKNQMIQSALQQEADNLDRLHDQATAKVSAQEMPKPVVSQQPNGRWQITMGDYQRPLYRRGEPDQSDIEQTKELWRENEVGKIVGQQLPAGAKYDQAHRNNLQTKLAELNNKIKTQTKRVNDLSAQFGQSK